MDNLMWSIVSIFVFNALVNLDTIRKHQANDT
jgi:hypothetical protein